MKYHSFSSPVKALILSSGLLISLGLNLVFAQEAEVPAEAAKPVVQEPQISQELMRSFLHLQEQVHATQLAVERGRLEAEAAAARNGDALTKRLEMLETGLDKASRENTAAIVESNRQIQESNSRMLLLAALFALTGFLALALTGWLQWRTISHLSSHVSTGYPTLLSQGLGSLPLGARTEPLANERLREALGRLEHRITEMESGSHPPVPLNAVSISSSNSTPASGSVDSHSPLGDELASVIREGEELLADEEAEKAIQLFDKILKKHPGHPEVLLRKGTALERLRRDQEAIECYDLAIRSDKNLTMAYLHKGGLFNRMERFGEAMECYEQALRIQEGRPAA